MKEPTAYCGRFLFVFPSAFSAGMWLCNVDSGNIE